MKNLITTLLVFISLTSLSQDGYVYNGNRNFWAYEVNEMNEKTFTKYDIDSIENEIIILINNLRLENGLNKVVKENSLEEYSFNLGENLLHSKEFKHSDIQNNDIVVENLFLINSFGTIPFTDERMESLSKEIYDNWFTSTKHRENMLSPNIKNIGVSINIKYSENYKVVSTMVGN
jgi:uncharacterized protein YkwD